MRHRKIESSKRHKKVKAVDPFYDGHRKKLLDKDAGLVNRAPKDIHGQEIPRKMKEMMEMSEKIAKGVLPVKRKRKKRRKGLEIEIKGDDFGVMQPGMKRPLKPAPTFKMKPHETEYTFLARVGRIAHEVVERTKLESKLDVDITRKESGEIQVTKQNDIDGELRKELNIEDDKKSGRKKSEKHIKRRIKEKEKKEKKKEDKIDEFKVINNDEIPFGEVVTQPPNLNFYPKNAPEKNTGYKSLILNKMLNTNNQAAPSTGKRKLLDPSQRQSLELEQRRVVHEYKKMKLSKQMEREKKLKGEKET